MYISAAFDTIDHNILLKKLQDEVGISDLAYQWLLSISRVEFEFVQVNIAS